MRKSFLLLALLPIFAVPASGQALKGHNGKAPVDFAADRIEVQDRADRVVLSGNVQIQQAGLSLRSSRMTVAYDDSRGLNVKRFDASGGVVVTSATETASGEFAIYDVPSRLITMVGGVTLNQGGNRVSGGRLLIDLNSGRAVMDGNSTSTMGPDGTVTRNGGRVTGHFTVSNKPQ